jgi:DNA repair protein RadC
MKLKRITSYAGAVEYKVVALRECPLPKELLPGDTPEQAVEYWRVHVETAAGYNPECESLVVVLLNSRMRVKGHHVVASGLLDSVMSHPREVFRCAVAASAYGILLMHNHPSGDPTPSAADLGITRQMARAGELLKIALFDHVIVGDGKHVSLRQLGIIQN